jgi:Spy/CpxP family protein refolding chaperone
MNKPLTFLTLAVASGVAITGITHLWAENAAPSPSPAQHEHAGGKGPHGDMRGGPGGPEGWGCRRDGGMGRFGHRGGPGGEMGHGQMMGRMLNLTDDQKAKVKAIMEANKPKIEEIRKEEQAKIQAVMEDSQKQIRPILTPEQQQVMDDAQKLREGAQKLREDAQKLKADKSANTAPAP